MWAIRILNGSQAGHIYPLKNGKHTLGRGSSCEMKIDSNSVSKEHAEVLVTGDKVILSDMNSRNGTFINGVRIQSQKLKLGDKIGLHDMLLDVLKVPDVMAVGGTMIPTGGIYPTPPPAWSGNAALRLQQSTEQMMSTSAAQMSGQPMANMAQDQMMAGNPAPTVHQQVSANSLGALFYNFKIYLDNVAMPGVYSIVQATQYRLALAAFLGIYALTVSAISTVPVVNTTKNNIRQESLRRAQTIARNMAANNRQALIDNNEINLNVRPAELEEGITFAALISAKDGTVIAPANKRQEYVNKPFVNRARREERETSEFIDDSTLGVSVPISVYSAENGAPTVIAYSVVLYDLGSLAMNSKQAFVLFMQNLLIATLAGFVLFFFLYKVNEHPLEVLNANLDEALREGRDDIRTTYKYPVLERLISNINSALSRISRDDSGKSASAFVVNRDVEANNLVRMLSTSAMAVNAIDDRVIATNSHFDKLVGGGVALQGRPLTDIPDVALQENLRELLPKMRGSIGEIALSEIPFAGMKYEICGQVIMGIGEEPAYFLIVLNMLGSA